MLYSAQLTFSTLPKGELVQQHHKNTFPVQHSDEQFPNSILIDSAAARQSLRRFISIQSVAWWSNGYLA